MTRLTLEQLLIASLEPDLDKIGYMPKEIAYETLKYNTHQDFGYDAKAWKKWLKENRRSIGEMTMIGLTGQSLLDYLRTATPDQKLLILRYETARPLKLVRDVASLLMEIDPSAVQGLPEKFDYMIYLLARAGDDLEMILDAATGPSKVEGTQ